VSCAKIGKKKEPSVSRDNARNDVGREVSQAPIPASALAAPKRVCVLVLGMHRSGTSALTRVMSLLGAALPKHIVPPHSSNETGHWEPELLMRLNEQLLAEVDFQPELLTRLNEELLAEAGATHLDWRAISLQTLAPERLRHFETEVSRILEEEFGAAPLIVLKDPRICRFVPLYIVVLDALGYEIKFIHMNRNPLEVGASLEKRNRITTQFANLIWMRHVLDAEAASRGRPRVFVSYEALLEDWRSTINKVKFGIALDLSIDPEKAASIDSFLNPKRRHHAVSRSALQEDQSVAQWLKDAYTAMIALEANENAPNAIEQLDRVRVEFNDAALHVGEAIRAEMTTRANRVVTGLEARFSAEIIAKDHELREKDYELRIKHHELREKDRVIAAHQARVEELNQVLDSHRAELALTSDLKNQLAAARSRPAKVFRDLLRHRVLSYLSRKSPPFSAKSAARFARSAQKRDPKRSLGRALEPTVRQGTLPTTHRPAAALDPRKKTILVVSHEASRSGGPIVALNLVQQLSQRYNVISLILGGGELADHFRQASASLYLVDRIQMTDRELDSVIKEITDQHPLMCAIVNSVESRRVLRALKADGVPTVSLIHEFSSNMRPRSAIHDMLTLSTETVFSTNITLESAVEDFWLYPGASIHLAPQGKCIVPARTGVRSDESVEKAWLTRNLRPEGGSRKFLVIGIGNIELRKGVDLFIECATIIKTQPGGERFQFVWIGNGFDPENEVAYSVYLADQMKRAELGSQMRILRSTSQIELAYQTADLLLLSSRLDPLPNVAIDALMARLPVLCFEKTTGIADFLNENGLGESCVADYLDTHDLARKVTALADSDDLRASVSERSRAAAQSAFDMNAYVSRIEAIATQAVGAEARVKEAVNAILASGKFRSDFFKRSQVETPPEEKIVEDYVRRMASGLDIRKPMPGFQPTVYAWLQSREGMTDRDPFVDFLRKGLPDGPWLQRVIQNSDSRKSAPTGGLRVALHLHAFYPDRLAGILERLNINASTPDIFISVISEDAAAQTRQALSTYRGRIVDVQVTPNLGRDIGPLLTQFGLALSGSYDIVGHLHTKKSAHVADRAFAEAWNTFLLENLVGGKRGGAMLDLILSSMASDPVIGIVFPDDPHIISWTGNRRYAEDLAARMKCGDLPEHFNFPIGSMFWMRAAVLKRFVELDLGWGDYAPEPVPIDGTMIHAIERLFGVVPATMGMTCAVTNVRGLTR
jgi:hypothetical protein